ncbi:methyl-accepting chemotaxis protein [Neptunomonas marina]|uniref:Methyl-accepting chemotaxis protein n=1 Tax=Neptunomonas marina TaxID=1815562 RepID=A0A437QAN9_9GAMM|nr:methyl-accepting chemotaxis protein [Neptunomonas marina]RVU31469.1 methyl-accepting chemotaxis protein [Neptunomonas marina]
MKISQKILASFAILTLTILIVGIGGIVGIGDINKQLRVVTDDSVPKLMDSYQQIVRINQANQALLKLLNNPLDKFDEYAESFNGHYTAFEEQVATLKSGQPADSKLATTLEQVQAEGSAYQAKATDIQALYKTVNKTRAEVITETQMFQSQIDSLSNWGQRYLSNDPPELPMIEIRKIMRTANKLRLSIRGYQRTRDIERLVSSAEKNRDLLTEQFNNFKQIESDGARIEGIIVGIQASIHREIGLMGAYIKLDQAQKQLQATLNQAETHLTSTATMLDSVLQMTLADTQAARASAKSTIDTSRMLIIGLCIAAIVLAVIVGIAVLNTIRRPLSAIQKSLEEVRDGNLTTRFDDHRNDEFGQLAQSLNLVVNSLQEILNRIVNNTQQLASVAESNASTSQETTSAMAEQSRQLELTAAAATEMESTVSDVSQHSDSTLQAVQNCESLSFDVVGKMGQTRESITSQSSAIEGAVHASTELENDSKKIDTILETINTIAEQTNLLALNAAIEAARAGDHGRGFAVVADEVRQLASRTQNSTEEIQNMVSSMQSRIRSVADNMRNSHDQATACVEYAQSSSDALETMQEAISSIRDMNTHIAEAAAQQNSAVREVNQTLVGISEVATETSMGAERAAQSSSTLLSIVQEQRQLISRFRI